MKTMNPYESDKLLSEYLLFHFGDPADVLPAERCWPPGMSEALGFPRRTVAHFGNSRVARGLDVGCAVGGSTFEMARHCDHVVGIDFSAAFIRAAETLRTTEGLPYHRLEEGALRTPLIARRPLDVPADAVVFQTGDAMDLPEDLGGFDRVHAANLICRLPEPLRFIDRLSFLVKPGGTLVLATPCTWLEEYTPRDNWPPRDTAGWLHDRLSPCFDLLKSAEEPFLIRETARKFQWSTSVVTVWHRR
jgi:putative 4-mercaptohistidine N1-methyltranferase